MVFALIVLAPLIAAMVAIALTNDTSRYKIFAIGGSALALLLTAVVTYGSSSYSWFTLSTYTFNIDILVAPLNFMLLVLVLLIGTLVMVYSAGYMTVPSEQRRFYFELLAFETSMALFSVSGNFITLFIAWEFLSLTSYLLIGFWNEKDSANRAARKALTIVFIGDVALLASLILFQGAFGTLEFSQIISASAGNTSAAFHAATLLLLVAIFTKSAQFPFHEWLTDAMEGPTPVSAYLHSSTMVKAGVFTAILLFPILMNANVLGIILLFAVITAIIATFCAMRETQIKKIIAYSTIQELSIMMIAVGSGAILAAVYFFFAQTFYKALLFFAAGNIMGATDEQDINETSGMQSNNLIYLTTLAGVLSLAGFIPFSGFFAGEGISSSLASNLPVYAILSILSLLTSFYIFRWFLLPSRKLFNPSLKGRYMTQPKLMVYPMVVLAILTFAASGFFIYIANFIGYGNYMPFMANQSMGLSPAGSALFLALVAIGAALSYLVYSREMFKVNVHALDAILYTNPIVNFLYSLASGFIYEVSEATTLLDSYINDAFDGIGGLTMQLSSIFRKVSVGEINLYALLVIIGILAMFAAFYALVIA